MQKGCNGQQHVKVADQPRRITCSLYRTLMTKTFSQESSEAFLNFTKSALRRTNKSHQRFLTDCFEENFEEKNSFCLASHKRNLLALSSFEYGFP